jgi:two-component sensor histidine kinase
MHAETNQQRRETAVLLINELSHRWLNSLTVISSEIEHCYRNQECAETLRQNLSMILDRIRSMAVLHRQLSRPPQTGVPIEEYCRAVCESVMLSFARNNISLRMEMDGPPLSSECTFRLGILIAELLTNALKHGKAPS